MILSNCTSILYIMEANTLIAIKIRKESKFQTFTKINKICCKSYRRAV